MSIPLVQNNDKDAINTSIIAIKRNIERINMLLGLVDSGSPDLSGLATKQELEDAVNSLQPVDEVALNNMQSVSSNAVAKANSYSTEKIFTGRYWIDGKPIYKKVFNYGTISSNSFTINTNANLETLVNYGGSVKVADIIRPFPYFDTTSNMKFVISAVNANNVYFYTAWGYGTEFVFFMEYTEITA